MASINIEVPDGLTAEDLQGMNEEERAMVWDVMQMMRDVATDAKKYKDMTEIVWKIYPGDASGKPDLPEGKEISDFDLYTLESVYGGKAQRKGGSTETPPMTTRRARSIPDNDKRMEASKKLIGMISKWVQSGDADSRHRAQQISAERKARKQLEAEAEQRGMTVDELLAERKAIVES